MSVFDDLANEIRAKLTPRANNVATYNPRDTYFKTSPKLSTNLMQNVLKTGGKVASKLAAPVSAATTGYTVGTDLDNLPNLIGQPNLSKSAADFILNPETGETASIPESIQPSLTSSPMSSMALPLPTREASGENVPLDVGLTESGEKLMDFASDVASDVTNIVPTLTENLVTNPMTDLLEQATGFNLPRLGDNQETVIEPTANNQPDGTGMVTTNFDDAVTELPTDSAESTAPTDNINLDAVNTTQAPVSQAPVADSAPVLTDPGASDSAPQRNFEKAKAEGTLTPEKIAQAKAFAAQYGKSFDPETGYSEQNLVPKPTGVSQAAQTATAGFKIPSFEDMKRALRVKFPNAEERNLSGLARVELSKLANAGLVTPSDAATLQGKELANKLAQQRLDAGPAFNQSQYDNQLIKDMGALQRKLTQDPDYKLTEYEQQRVFEYDASRRNKMGQMAEFYDPFLDQFKDIPKSEEEVVSKDFNTKEEAELAAEKNPDKFPVGTKITIKGKPAVITK